MQVRRTVRLRKNIQVSIERDRCIFLPLPRSSDSWQRSYDKRTAVERVNSRLDVSFGFEQHYIRGLKKMRFRCTLALCIMLAMAIGRIEEKRPDLMHNLVKTA